MTDPADDGTVPSESSIRSQSRPRHRPWPPLYRRTWSTVSDGVRLLRPLRVNLLIIGLITLALSVPEQSRDIFRTLAEQQPLWRFLNVVPVTWVFSVALWFTSFRMLEREPRHPRKTPRNACLRRWLPVIISGGPSLILAVSLLAAYSDLHPQANLLRGRLLWMAAWALGSAVVPVSAACGLDRCLRRFPDKSKQARAALCFVHTICILTLVMAFSIGTFTPKYAAVIGPLATIFFSATFWCYSLVWFVRCLDHYRVPLVTVLFLLALMSGVTDCNDTHEIRRFCRPPDNPVLAAREDFIRWLASRDDYVRGRRYPVFVVAAEGGGLRNAYWTASVLCHLHDRFPQFNDHLYAISGVSGGSIGATVYAALVRDHDPSVPLLPRAQQILAHDLLSPVMAKGAIPDLLPQVFPISWSFLDRARGLEDALDNAWHDVEQTPRMHWGFYALRGGGTSRSVPCLILNTTEVESGERVPVSHVNLSSVRVMATVLDREIPLNTAACLSARFPAVTPAGTVRVPGGKLRYVDGGYFENSGTATLLNLLSDIISNPTASASDAVDLRDVEFCVISPIYVATGGKEPAESAHSFGDLASPLRTILATREARGRQSREELDRFLAGAVVQGFHAPFNSVRFEARDAETAIPLGWTLSDSARRAMDEALPDTAGTNGREPNRDGSNRIGALLGRVPTSQATTRSSTNR